MSSTYPLYIFGFLTTLAIVILTFVIIVKSEKIRQLLQSIKHLQNSLDQMDEQAKLIVRTDLELNKIQEELDKKITGLYTLHRLSRAFASTLDEKEILNQIRSEHIEELGMQRAIGFIWQPREKRFSQGLTIGYSQEELDNIMLEVESKQDVYLELIEQEKTLSSRIADTKFISLEEVKRVFQVQAFCISPILPKEGSHGFLFVGTESSEIPITEGDEELITILAHSIGQAFENARLFEASWRAQQELEKRVEQRTQELTEVVKELKNVSKRKSDFVSAVSHELRTPLTSIKGYASILLSKNLGKIADPIKERLEKINRHSDELVHMVNNLLDISRLESGRITMKKQPYNLKELVENTIDLLSVQIKQKGLRFSADIPAHLRVLVDKSQIERVFVNLVGNAIKFTPEKGKISVTTQPVNNFVQVNISDTGIGIPKEAQKTIFEEFYRVDNPINEKVKGTGLGLSLVKNIIEAHQGSIWIKSEVGSGSTFSFTLPTEDVSKG
ncbi:MAG: GAF domain-containing sensor histidine kinase [Candidatus Omnitrophota bacterium]|jgi:signal transduction histidine kinase